ncbi:MAG TPA: aminoglycoside phosphotransferase family protein [Candidatus Nanopelagicales bacterium]|jgi:aminoglycoside phosphotransferase (APT) family kinase protein
MRNEKMHDEEWDIDAPLVRRLVSGQLEQWADLPIERVSSTGTDNALFRLGEDMVVRLPRIQSAGEKGDKEHRWLPRFAPLLPLSIPLPLAAGRPAAGYPWHWSVHRWLEGENATADRLDDPVQAAQALGEFVAALHRIDPGGGPAPGDHNGFRGDPLATRDRDVRQAIAVLGAQIDTAATTRVWQAALDSPAWEGPPVWVHGDLHAGNLLADRGRLCAVIDFGCLGVGDPAVDVMAAWTFLPPPARDVFRTAVDVDDATWARGRGWALSMALIALPYYTDRNPPFAADARRWLGEVLADP